MRAVTYACVPAGIVPIAHNSGGPMMDIVSPSSGEAGDAVGYRCESDEEYAQAISDVLSMEQSRRLQIAAAARRYGRAVSAQPEACHSLSEINPTRSLAALSRLNPAYLWLVQRSSVWCLQESRNVQ